MAISLYLSPAPPPPAAFASPLPFLSCVPTPSLDAVIVVEPLGELLATLALTSKEMNLKKFEKQKIEALRIYLQTVATKFE